MTFSTGVHIEVRDARYDAGVDSADDAVAPVRTDIEATSWGPIAPTPGTPGPIAFVDGVQRIEAWLRASAIGDEQPTGGAVAAIAVGYVLCPPDERPHIAGIAVRRLVISFGSRMLRLPPTAAMDWQPRRADDRVGGDAIRRTIAADRSAMEQTLAEELIAPGRLVVLDGRLDHVRSAGGAVMGAIKTHQRTYLHGSKAAVVTQLAVGERTPLFAIGDDRLSWYQRLPVDRAEHWNGILRGELSSATPLDEAAALADRAARELPAFAGRLHRDTRAPQNLGPIGALERVLRRRLGDARLALRATREAALRAGLVAGADETDVAA